MSKKKRANVRELIDQYSSNNDRILEIADLCEKEGRSRNEKEEAEYQSLSRANSLLQMKIQAATTEYSRENPNAKEEAEKIIRDNAAHGRKTEIRLVRDVMTVSDVESGSIIPLNVNEIIKPLVEGFLLDKVGLPMPIGLSGDFVWPIYEMISATVLQEAARITDSKIPFSKMTAAPARIGVAVPVSNQSLNQTDGILEYVIREIIPLSIRMLLNSIILGRRAVNNVAKNAGLVGPFVEALKTKVNLSAVPTFIELNAKMKARVLGTGIDGEHMCWTMTKAMAAILEGTPINEKGIFVPMLQNGTLCGLPVYTSNEMRDVAKSYKKYTSGSWADYTLADGDEVKYTVSGDTAAHALAQIADTPEANDIAEVNVITEYIGLGDWRYQPMGLFNDLRFIVDPYSKAREDSVDFVLNCDYATKTLRPEAFVIGQVAVSR